MSGEQSRGFRDGFYGDFATNISGFSVEPDSKKHATVSQKPFTPIENDPGFRYKQWYGSLGSAEAIEASIIDEVEVDDNGQPVRGKANNEDGTELKAYSFTKETIQLGDDKSVDTEVVQ